MVPHTSSSCSHSLAHLHPGADLQVFGRTFRVTGADEAVLRWVRLVPTNVYFNFSLCNICQVSGGVGHTPTLGLQRLLDGGEVLSTSTIPPGLLSSRPWPVDPYLTLAMSSYPWPREPHTEGK